MAPAKQGEDRVLQDAVIRITENDETTETCRQVKDLYIFTNTLFSISLSMKLHTNLETIK